MNSPYSKDVDILISKLLDKYDFTNIGYYTAMLGSTEIWVANRPYAAIVIENNLLCNYRPSRLTIQRALRKLDNTKKVTQYQKEIDQIMQLNNLQP